MKENRKKKSTRELMIQVIIMKILSKTIIGKKNKMLCMINIEKLKVCQPFFKNEHILFVNFNQYPKSASDTQPSKYGHCKA